MADLGYPKDLVGFDTQGNFGGTVSLLGGEVAITFVPAVHSSSITPDDEHVLSGGAPGGFVIAVRDGPTIYHTGDTDVFGDMAMLRRRKIDVMLTCIGDHFTMGPDGAAEAVKLVRPRTVVPMHFGTFPVLTGTVPDFARALKHAHVRTRLRAMKVGETIAL